MGFVDSEDDHPRHYTLGRVPSPLTLDLEGERGKLRSGLGRLEGEREPLVIATDAQVIDSSNLSIEEVVSKIVARLKMKGMVIELTN